MRTETGKEQQKTGKQPDARKLAAELDKLKKVLEDKTAAGPVKSRAIDRMRMINRETDPARDALW